MNDQFLFDGHPDVKMQMPLRLNWEGAYIDLPWWEARGLSIYDCRWLMPDDQPWLTEVRKTGFVVHHDGGGYSGELITDALTRIRVIWDDHRQRGWNGVGYHVMCDHAGRLYLTGSLDTHRAHTAQKDPAGNGWTLNFSKVGFCFMGDFTGPNGIRPTNEAIESFKAGTQLITDALDRSMDLSAHKRWENKPCPGTWATAQSWQGTSLTPSTAPPALTYEDGLEVGRATMRAFLQDLEAAIAPRRE